MRPTPLSTLQQRMVRTRGAAAHSCCTAGMAGASHPDLALSAIWDMFDRARRVGLALVTRQAMQPLPCTGCHSDLSTPCHMLVSAYTRLHSQPSLCRAAVSCRPAGLSATAFCTDVHATGRHGSCQRHETRHCAGRHGPLTWCARRRSGQGGRHDAGRHHRLPAGHGALPLADAALARAELARAQPRLARQHAGCPVPDVTALLGENCR